MPRPHLEDQESGIPLAGMEDYRTYGWTAVRGFFTAGEAALLSDWTDEVYARPQVRGEHMVYYEESLQDPRLKVVQRIENFCPYHSGFDSLVRFGRLQSAASALLGGPAVLFKEKINFKMPGGAGFELHQDQQAGWSRYAPLFVTALVSIDEATAANGCLEMTDAPRFDGLLGPEWTPLSADEMGRFSLSGVPTAPGDVIFFDSYVPHASKPNLTNRARRILYLTYNLQEHGDHRCSYFEEKRANFPPNFERLPGTEYKFRV